VEHPAAFFQLSLTGGAPGNWGPMARLWSCLPDGGHCQQVPVWRLGSGSLPLARDGAVRPPAAEGVARFIAVGVLLARENTIRLTLFSGSGHLKEGL